MPFGVHSEVGRLRRVMVHRPGLEHTRLTPSNAEELLFDDVIWVARAKAEHDMFCEVMRDRGVEVFHVEQLLAEALDQPGGQGLGQRPHPGRARGRHRGSRPGPGVGPGLGRRAGGGVPDRRDHQADVDQDVGLVWESADPTSMLLPPLPNLLFQRDPSCWIFDGVTINPMTKPARKPETMIMEAIYRFHPMFAAEKFPIWLGGTGAGLGPRPRRGRRRAADRQRHRDDRHGRAHHSAGGAVDRPLAVPGRVRDAGARGAPAQVPQLHAPGHRHHDVRPRPGHPVPPGRRRGADLVDPARRVTRRPGRRGTAGVAARADGQGAGRGQDARHRDRRRHASRPSASSGTTATTWSRSSPGW